MTPKAGGKVDENQVTQLGRALKELGTKMIPAYSPQARGRMERSYHVARAPAAGTASAPDYDSGGGQPVEFRHGNPSLEIRSVKSALVC